MAVVLKNKVVGSREIRPARFSLADVRAEADAIVGQAHRELDEARARAEAVVNEAHLQAEDIKRQAEAQGRRDGYEKGLAEGREIGAQQALEEARKDFNDQARQLGAALEELLSNVDRQRHGLITQAQQELLALAVAIAEKIVHRRIEFDSEAVLANVRSAVELVAGSTAIRIRMHPTDLQRLKLFDQGSVEKYFAFEQITFVEDDGIEPGGCVLGTAGGEIDAQVSTQIESIARHFAPTSAEKIKSWQDPGDKGTADDRDVNVENSENDEKIDQ